MLLYVVLLCCTLAWYPRHYHVEIYGKVKYSGNKGTRNLGVAWTRGEDEGIAYVQGTGLDSADWVGSIGVCWKYSTLEVLVHDRVYVRSRVCV